MYAVSASVYAGFVCEMTLSLHIAAFPDDPGSSRHRTQVRPRGL
jgi:hypothetical protein